MITQESALVIRNDKGEPEKVVLMNERHQIFYDVQELDDEEIKRLLEEK